MNNPLDLHRRALLGAAFAAPMIGSMPAFAKATRSIHGTTSEAFGSVRDAFALAQAVDPGGAQLCIYHRGECVVDLWTGHDPIKGRDYTADTVAILNSCTKGVMSTLTHIFVRRGQIDLDAPVARYWPEFAAAGKGQITVATMLAHKAGLSAFPADAGIDVEALLDWDRCVTTLANMEPLWTPGTAFRYHAVTFGFLTGELLRRVTGKRPHQLVAEELRQPLGIRLWLGDFPAEEEVNFAPQFSSLPPPPSSAASPYAVLGADAQAPVVRASMAGASLPTDLRPLLNTRRAHLAEIPASGGIANARALARMYAATIGEVDGVRLLDAKTVDRARTLQTAGLGQPPPLDRIPVPHPLRFGVGYELRRSNVPMPSNAFGHTGAGGRLAFADPERGIAAAYVCNNSLWKALTDTDARWSWTAALARIA